MEKPQSNVAKFAQKFVESIQSEARKKTLLEIADWLDEGDHEQWDGPDIAGLLRARVEDEGL